ncbi:MAG: adenosine kinase [Alphaproteobacteria bacterium]|nr:adenosine kinase [Alphaproteobacteria bacterium]
MTESYHVVGIGNAIVDVLAHASDSFLTEQNLPKGAMTLIDAHQAQRLYAQMGPAIECSGGSAANTMAGIASLKGAAAYIGKVHDDVLGRVFRHDLSAIGVHYRTPSLRRGPTTARCLILVTPDAQRTMQTYLGACIELGPEDIDEDLIVNSQVTYLEGYLYDPPRAKEAFKKAAKLAHGAGRKVALSLSDSFCVNRHRAEFLEFAQGYTDILFANESEIESLFQTDNFDLALQKARGLCSVVVLTRSAKGSVVVAGDEMHVIDAEKVHKVEDTTGAGDLFAAGFLWALTQNRSLADSARAGGICAAEVISHIGARPSCDLAKLMAEKLG